jgi:hypothetical protein
MINSLSPKKPIKKQSKKNKKKFKEKQAANLTKSANRKKKTKGRNRLNFSPEVINTPKSNTTVNPNNMKTEN